MEPKELKTRNAARVARHRKRMAASGARRVEVTVPARDASLVKAIAGALRSDGEEAGFIRRSLQPVLATPRDRAGSELVAFLRGSLTEAELSMERDEPPLSSVDVREPPFPDLPPHLRSTQLAACASRYENRSACRVANVAFATSNPCLLRSSNSSPLSRRRVVLKRSARATSPSPRCVPAGASRRTAR